MKRVVITGIGILSSIGNNKKEVIYSLYNGISGIEFSQEMRDFGMRSQVWGKIKLDVNYLKKERICRFMNDGTIYAFLAFKEALQDSNLKKNQYQKNPRVGIIAGSGAAASKYHVQSSSDTHGTRCFKTVNPYIAIKTMPSNISSCLSSLFHLYGVNYSISSACATSAHCIGNAFELIRSGKQDVIFAGGGEEISLELACQFDAMKVLSTNFNYNPIKASRAYDIQRDGFVISGGGGILVLEDLNYALSRSTYIYGEIIGYASNSDGLDMFVPSGEGAIRCMNLAKKEEHINVDYINAHGTSTKIGDLIELNAINKVFINSQKPIISSTKSMSGHSLGASGVHEMIYTLLMMKEEFIAPSINIDILEPNAKNMNILRKVIKKKIITAMSNSFGFGGTNVSLVVKKY